jgi:ParE toxin of type II toxin-antitoxin system, parDE
MPARVTVRMTANFQRNLDSICAFLGEYDSESTFERLLEDLFDLAIPNLESFPDMRVDFLSRVPASRQGRLRLTDLTRRLGNESNLRELILGEYLILYAVRGEALYLLAIKHHLQLSFDLPGHWGR